MQYIKKDGWMDDLKTYLLRNWFMLTESVENGLLLFALFTARWFPLRTGSDHHYSHVCLTETCIRSRSYIPYHGQWHCGISSNGNFKSFVACHKDLLHHLLTERKSMHKALDRPLKLKAVKRLEGEGGRWLEGLLR